MPRKKDKYVGPDPDPTDYLYVSLESKRLSSERPYDSKKACWVPCAKDGFAVGEIREVKGDQLTVFASNKVLYITMNVIHFQIIFFALKKILNVEINSSLSLSLYAV